MEEEVDNSGKPQAMCSTINFIIIKCACMRTTCRERYTASPLFFFFQSNDVLIPASEVVNRTSKKAVFITSCLGSTRYSLLIDPRCCKLKIMFTLPDFSTEHGCFKKKYLNQLYF